MEFIKNQDLQLITTLAGAEVNNVDFKNLKVVYSKLKYICDLLQNKGFKYEIRQDPRKQAGSGKFVFQDYHWAKVYPAEYFNDAKDKFAYIIGFSDSVHFHLMGIKDYQYLEPSTQASKQCWKQIDFENKDFDFVVDEFVEFDKQNRKLFIETGSKLDIPAFKKIHYQMNNENLRNLLAYKKQIILQGPPGTGKTRLAKEIAESLTNDKDITDNDIIKWVTVGTVIQSAKGSAQYLVEDNSDRKIILKRSNENLGETSFDKIVEYYNGKKWKEEIKDNDKRRAAALAKFIFDKKFPANNEYVKLIQFHPAYTYEDFVRGIVAESNGTAIEYKNVNKTLGLFAKDALANFNASTSASPEAMVEAWVDEKFELFKKDIEAKLPEDELVLSGDITIFQVGNAHFKYAEKWKTPGYLNFVEFKKLVRATLNGELELSHKQVSKEKFIHAHYRYTYYSALLKLFFDEYRFEKEVLNVEAKNYVLIIDEINRANLSSVLGELIYALEYRGEEVESMYEVEGSQKLILPPNLYILGTMNTADRSVGHIDYAIKRRFAFVDVLPKVLEEGAEMTFKVDLFEKVSRLFITNLEEYRSNPKAKLQRAKTLSQEFRPEDIWLGHSYFIQKKEKDGNGNDILVPPDFSVRLEYEIKPILQEYVKDGVLIGFVSDEEDSQKKEIPVEDYIHSLS